MTTIELKYNFHKLIDTIQNEKVLTTFYDIMSNANTSNDGLLWSRLTKEEQDELIHLEYESRDITNLISHSEMQFKHKKWL